MLYLRHVKRTNSGYKGPDFLDELSGIFAFVLYDEEKDAFLIARDPIGVIPLYIGYDADGTVYVASELKALEGQCERYEPFLPGHCYWSGDPGQKRWYRRAHPGLLTESERAGICEN